MGANQERKRCPHIPGQKNKQENMKTGEEPPAVCSTIPRIDHEQKETFNKGEGATKPGFTFPN